MVNFDNVDIIINFPVVFLLEQTLYGITGQAFEAQKQKEEEDFLVFQGLLYPDSLPVRLQQVHEEHEKEGEYHCSTKDEDNIKQASRHVFHPPQTLECLCY